jgi:lipopolysaccharide/colanic/teichoic acid biosynthesis glycosyltransferase
VLAGDPRVTRIGRILRRTSVDELPQLFNVLRGDMNIVGPRPERPSIFVRLREQIEEYPVRQRVKPGITGWAQVNGRNAISWDDKFALDVWYVDNRSLWLDVRILWRTVRKVLVRDGISAAGEATMPKFTGSKS